MKRVTVDTMALSGTGTVTVAQPVRGHRFTLDSILLADFCRIRRDDSILEPGCGTGIVSLLLAKRYPRASITAVEIQREAAELCQRNVHVNGLGERVTVIHLNITDLNRHLKPGIFDVIVANPPYATAATGKVSPLAARRSARHRETPDLAPWIGLQHFLRNRGRLFLVFASSGAAGLLAELSANKLEPKRVRWVHPAPSRPASLVLIEAIKGGGTGMEVLPPLMVHGPHGEYSGEMTAMYGLPA